MNNRHHNFNASQSVVLPDSRMQGGNNRNGAGRDDLIDRDRMDMQQVSSSQQNDGQLARHMSHMNMQSSNSNDFIS